MVKVIGTFFFTFTGSVHDYYSKCTDSQLNKIDEDRERLRVRVRVSEGWHLQEQQFVSCTNYRLTNNGICPRWRLR